MSTAQMQCRPGFEPFQYAAGRMVVESRRFIWQPRFLPVVAKNHSWWDGKTYRWAWLCFATLRGTDFGWEAIVSDK